MITKVLLLSAVVTAFTFSSLAAPVLLSPRAKGNQIKHVSNSTGSPSSTAYVAATPALLSPRAQGNQFNVVKGVYNEVSLALACRSNMLGSPRAVTECSSHANMPGCAANPSLKYLAGQ